MRKIGSTYRYDITIGKTLVFSNIALTKWYVDVSPRVKFIVFSPFVILILVVFTLEVVGQLPKSYKVGSSGPLYLEMLIDSILLVSVVNVRVPCPIVI